MNVEAGFENRDTRCAYVQGLLGSIATLYTKQEATQQVLRKFNDTMQQADRLGNDAEQRTAELILGEAFVYDGGNNPRRQRAVGKELDTLHEVLGSVAEAAQLADSVYAATATLSIATARAVAGLQTKIDTHNAQYHQAPGVDCGFPAQA